MGELKWKRQLRQWKGFRCKVLLNWSGPALGEEGEEILLRPKLGKIPQLNWAPTAWQSSSILYLLRSVKFPVSKTWSSRGLVFDGEIARLGIWEALRDNLDEAKAHAEKARPDRKRPCGLRSWMRVKRAKKVRRVRGPRGIKEIEMMVSPFIRLFILRLRLYMYLP